MGTILPSSDLCVGVHIVLSQYLTFNWYSQNNSGFCYGYYCPCLCQLVAREGTSMPLCRSHLDSIHQHRVNHCFHQNNCLCCWVPLSCLAQIVQIQSLDLDFKVVGFLCYLNPNTPRVELVCSLLLETEAAGGPEQRAIRCFCPGTSDVLVNMFFKMFSSKHVALALGLCVQGYIDVMMQRVKSATAKHL